MSLKSTIESTSVAQINLEYSGSAAGLSWHCAEGSIENDVLKLVVQRDAQGLTLTIGPRDGTLPVGLHVQGSNLCIIESGQATLLLSVPEGAGGMAFSITTGTSQTRLGVELRFPFAASSLKPPHIKDKGSPPTAMKAAPSNPLGRRPPGPSMVA